MSDETGKPDLRFFVIGAARSGTTSLYKALTAHPRIFAPSVKEPRFFNENWSKGWPWFHSLYADARPDQICGDFSPSYSNGRDRNASAARLAKAYPQARLLYIVRNPIECAISNWRMIAEIRDEQQPFGEALDSDWASSVLYRAMFFKQVQFFRDCFPDEQILVVPLERIRLAVPEWMGRIQRHIGLPEEDIRDLPFFWANASARKPNRPPTPDIPMEDRERFLEMVRPDAEQLLDLIGETSSLWTLTVTSPAWAKGTAAAEARKAAARSGSGD